MTSEASLTGRGHPPVQTRFRKGQSGNPRGRPRGSKRAPPYEALLGQTVTLREDGVARRMTAGEAFVRHVTRRGLEGDGAAARAAIAAIEEARARRGPPDHDRVTRIVIVPVSVGSVHRQLIDLNAGVKLDRYRETARTVLEPWLVEIALSRLSDRRLSIEEQRIVWKSTRAPWKVKWPEWWQVGLKQAAPASTSEPDGRS